MKGTLTKAWDQAWDETCHVHLLGSGLKPSADALVVQKALGELSKMKLPIRAVDAISYAVRKAYECGKHGSIAGNKK